MPAASNVITMNPNWSVLISKNNRKLAISINPQDPLMTKGLQNGNQTAVVHIIHVRD